MFSIHKIMPAIVNMFQRSSFSYTVLCILLISLRSVICDLLNNVSDNEKNAIRKLVNDGTKSLSVSIVKKVNNTKLLSVYLQKKSVSLNSKRITQMQLNGNGKYVEEPKTANRLPTFLENNLDPDKNEFYLFHGTQYKNIEPITSNGFDLSKSQPGFFGKGIYTAEVVAKSLSYTDGDTDSRQVIIIARVLMGKTYLCGLKNYSNSCTRDKDGSEVSILFDCGDCTVAQEGDSYREFVVYEDSRIYPEYVVYFNVGSITKASVNQSLVVFLCLSLFLYK